MFVVLGDRSRCFAALHPCGSRKCEGRLQARLKIIELEMICLLFCSNK